MISQEKKIKDVLIKNDYCYVTQILSKNMKIHLFIG